MGEVGWRRKMIGGVGKKSGEEDDLKRRRFIRGVRSSGQPTHSHRLDPNMFRFELVLSFSLSIIFLRLTAVQSKCPKTCDLALGSYSVWLGTNLTFISTVSADSITDILGYNTYITNADSIDPGNRINLPFTCDCIDDEFLGHVFPYTVQSGDTYYEIAQTYYANLTTPAMLEQFNSYPASNVPVNAVLNVTVNCSCGDASVSKAYGLFVTYPLRVGDSLGSIAATADLSTDLLQSYNPGVDFSAGSGLVYIPGKAEVESKVFQGL
ncbi:hypothetical protein RHGRI_009956 [Rhododendron griersonianum]|uniref:LysM domain-containing protein n=1 Tax=Rhododendron griersonianum TaxID=479676 RepID=A0AAV6KHF4_9ERIC|nr:hypothetical protein RHGRI_009956 [Rhododendron griersonianum]